LRPSMTGSTNAGLFCPGSATPATALTGRGEKRDLQGRGSAASHNGTAVIFLDSDGVIIPYRKEEKMRAAAKPISRLAVWTNLQHPGRQVCSQAAITASMIGRSRKGGAAVGSSTYHDKYADHRRCGAQISPPQPGVAPYSPDCRGPRACDRADVGDHSADHCEQRS